MIAEIFKLSEVDAEDHIWLMEKYSTRKQRRVPLMPGYEQFRCPQCGKIEEYQALRTGISPAVRIKTKTDMVGTFDGFTVVSKRFCSLIERSGIQGVEFLPIPSHEYHVMAPSLLAPTDLRCCERHGMVFDTRCPKCGRYRETSGGWPVRSCMKIPSAALVIFGSDVRLESRVGIRSNFYVSEKVRVMLLEAHITGIDDFISVG